MDDGAVWKFSPEQELTPADELLLFLMTICHQDYFTALDMPVDRAMRMVQGFGGWIQKIFAKGAGTDDLSHAFVPNLTMPQEWVDKMNRDKANTHY